MFKKLALVTAIAALPVSGFAMEALEDSALSEVTGQDGVTISIATVDIDAIRVDDSNAFTGSSAADGAIFISNISVAAATTLTIDADTDTIQATAFLGAGTIDLGEIAPGAYQAATAGTTVIDLGSMTHGGITANVQLGAEDQGAMIRLSGIVTGGLTLAGFSIADGSSTETISMNLGVTSAGSTDLNLAGDIDVVAGGLQVSGLGAMDIEMGSLTLGSSTAIGDVSILNLQLGNITISGH